MNNSFLILAIVILSICLRARCADPAGALIDDDADEEPECLPSEADVCFKDVNENLICHLQSATKRNCAQRTAKDLCVGLDDALNCTADIIDNGCSISDGAMVFDNWLGGLRGVYTRLCRQEDYSLLNDLLQSDKCWNFKSFIRCVENKANLTHITDLLTTNLDQHECNLLQMVVSVCNDKAEKNRDRCMGKADAVNEAVAAFFSSSLCAGAIPIICEASKAQEQKAVSKTTSSSTGLAVFLTLAVVVILLALVAFLVVRRNIITINTRFGLPRRDEGVEESREDYGRFL